MLSVANVSALVSTAPTADAGAALLMHLKAAP